MRVRAVYRDGHFEPVVKLEVEEGAEVEIVFPPKQFLTQEEFLKARRSVFGSASREATDEVDKIVEQTFEKIDEEHWR